MRNIKLVVTLVLVVLLISSFSYALQVPGMEKPVGDTAEFAKTALSVISFIAWAVAFGMILVIGIKYMSRGAGFKADSKDMIVTYLVGTILIAFTSTIVNFVVDMHL